MKKSTENVSLYRWIAPAGLLLILLCMIFSLGSTSRTSVHLFDLYKEWACLVSTAFLLLFSLFMSAGRTRLERTLRRTGHLSILPFVILTIGLLACFTFFTSFSSTATAFYLIAFLSGATVVFLLLSLFLLYSDSRKAFFRTAALVGSLICGLFLGEAVFRFVLVSPYVPTQSDGFRPSVTTNYDETDGDVSSRKDFCLLGLSDSFGVYGSEKNYHYLLSNLLKERELAVRLVNFSKGGLNPADQLALLERFGTVYMPDLVLHGFYVGNDFFSERTDFDRGDLMQYKGIVVRRPRSLRSLLPHNLLVVRWLYNYFIVKKFLLTTMANPTVDTMEETDFSREVFEKIERRWLEDHCRIDDSGRATQWQVTLDYIDKIRSEASRMDADYILLIHPEQIQVDSRLRGSILDAYGLDPSHYNLDSPQQYLMQYCRETELRCIDLLEEFRHAGHPEELFLENNGHYTEQGNALAAAIAAEGVSRVCSEPQQDESPNIPGLVN